jgi:hypothetical protein
VNKLIDSNEVTETYETAMGIVTIWKKDGKDPDGMNGKEGTSRMKYFDPQPIKMALKKKFRKS